MRSDLAPERFEIAEVGVGYPGLPNWLTIEVNHLEALVRSSSHRCFEGS